MSAGDCQQRVGEDDDDVRHQAAQRPRRTAAGEFRISGAVASMINSLLL